jgi:hypothetical protein
MDSFVFFVFVEKWSREETTVKEKKSPKSAYKDKKSSHPFTDNHIDFLRQCNFFNLSFDGFDFVRHLVGRNDQFGPFN